MGRIGHFQTETLPPDFQKTTVGEMISAGKFQIVFSLQVE
jgi:hypothetical protein